MWSSAGGVAPRDAKCNQSAPEHEFNDNEGVSSDEQQQQQQQLKLAMTKVVDSNPKQHPVGALAELEIAVASSASWSRCGESLMVARDVLPSCLHICQCCNSTCPTVIRKSALAVSLAQSLRSLALLVTLMVHFRALLPCDGIECKFLELWMKGV